MQKNEQSNCPDEEDPRTVQSRRNRLFGRLAQGHTRMKSFVPEKIQGGCHVPEEKGNPEKEISTTINFFSLLELLIVITIIIILVSFLLPAILKARKSAHSIHVNRKEKSILFLHIFFHVLQRARRFLLLHSLCRDHKHHQ